ncbi:hypothetical protein [Candidatus Parabeggiatoa sp. HSG14]|uniref:hypothetical protein n=1 Tax=Candidatus Parabeggiatoa sp. HSG14 TaxID=3055593 RepID=UPI0025A6D34E|nr:hypothetical protein [Thiotrichales bacterium HSG14]
MSKKYNFGFLGLSGSGKTCILAALDMQRRAHPAGYACALLPLDIAPPTGDKDAWTDAEKEADELHKSSQRLREAKQQLEEGSVPMATELTYDIIFDYEFSSEETGPFQARLIDYGGELAGPEGYLPGKTELRDKLAGMDGLFIIAPAPHPTKKDKAKSEFFNLLQNTLTRIPFNQPIVLLINKWDRIAPLPEYTVSQEALTSDKLPSTEHRDLYNVLINKVGEENCKAFPLSAFGEYEQRTTAGGREYEFPKQVNPLASFGLLEGFIWMAQRLKIIPLQSYERDIDSYKKWIPYPSLPLWKLKDRGDELIPLFPKDSKLVKRTRQAQHQSSWIWWTRLISLSFLLMIIPLLGLGSKQAYDDEKKYDEVHSILNNPKAQLDDIKTAEQWLENYYYTKPYSHPFSWLFVVSNQTAKLELDKLRHQREQFLWQVIQDAPSLQNKRQACESYLKALPNGEHIGDVKTIIAQIETELREEPEKQWWIAIEQAPTQITKLEAARQYQKKMPDGRHNAKVENIITQIEEQLRLHEEKRWWQPVDNAQSPQEKIETAQTYLHNLPNGDHAVDADREIAQAKETIRLAKEKLRDKETKRVAKEQQWWQPVVNAKSPLTKIEATQAYLQNIDNGEHVAEATTIIAQAQNELREEKKLWQSVIAAKSPLAKIEMAQLYLQAKPKGIYVDEAKVKIEQAKNAIRVIDEQRWWQHVVDAKSPQEKIDAANAYLQEKPHGDHAANAKNVITQAEIALHNKKEQRWWLPVEQAGSLEIKAEKADAYLEELPNGKHAAEAAIIIAKADSEKEWIAFKIEYYNWFNNGAFLEAAQYLSRPQFEEDTNLQDLKQQFLENVFKSLDKEIKRLIERRRWSTAYKPLDNYAHWPSEFQNQERRTKIQDLRKRVQVAEDRFLYTVFLEAKDLERAENYLNSAPLQAMKNRVTAYQEYLIKMQNPLGLLRLILARIEWGDINENNNTITVFVDGKTFIEKAGINADARTSTGEIGRSYFKRKLSDLVTIEVKIVENNWISDNDDNGQGRKKVKVANLNGFSLVLKPLGEEEPISRAVFRLVGIPRKPQLPSWEEN